MGSAGAWLRRFPNEFNFPLELVGVVLLVLLQSSFSDNSLLFSIVARFYRILEFFHIYSSLFLGFTLLLGFDIELSMATLRSRRTKRALKPEPEDAALPAKSSSQAQAKRRRPNVKRGWPWFDDGNVILVAEETGFKVSRAVHGYVCAYIHIYPLLSRFTRAL